MTEIVPVSGHVDSDRREHWRPRLRSGYFFIKDRQYYLFSRKRTILVRDAQQVRHELAGMPVDGSVQVKIEGVEWDNWRIEGRDIVVSLMGLEGTAAYWAQLDWDVTLWDSFKTSIEALGDNWIEVSYDYYTWDNTPAPSGQKFTINPITQYFRIGDAESTYHLPDDYVPGAPVVITDDSFWYTDYRTHRVQFTITEPKRSVVFNMDQNLVHNPFFHRGTPSLPSDWYLTDPTGAVWAQGSGYVMDRFIRVRPTGMAVQEVPVTGSPVTVDVWVRGSGEARLELLYKSGSTLMDQYGAVIGIDPNFGLRSYVATSTLRDEWIRMSAVLGIGTEFDPADALYPDICDRIEVRLGVTSGYADFGAASVRMAPRPSLFNNVSPSGTIEYETDPSGFWRHYPRDVFPWEAEWDADMNAVNTPASMGFLVIGEEAAPVDYRLGLGNLTFDEPASFGTVGYAQGLLPWPSGVRHEFGRRHLPYAKTRGHNKLRQTPTFDLDNQQPALFEITEPRRPRDPSNVVIGSPASMYRDTVTGNSRLVLWSNRGRAEYVTAKFLDNWGNPVIHDWVEILPSGDISAYPSGAYTDQGGRVDALISYQSGNPVVTYAGVEFRHRASGRSGSIQVHIV